MKTNKEFIREYHETRKKMRELADNNRYEEHNKLVPRIQELAKTLIDWGYRKGDVVERRTGRGWEEDVILKVKGSEMHFRTMILPPAMIRRPIKNQLVKQEREFEQICFWE